MLDFVHHGDTLKIIKLHSEQADILTLMLNDVCASCTIFKSYAEPQMCTLSSSTSLVFVNILLSVDRMLNSIGGELDKKIKDLSDALVERRRAFLDLAIISTQNTTSQILDDVAKISTRLQDLKSQVSDAGR